MKARHASCLHLTAIDATMNVRITHAAAAALKPLPPAKNRKGICERTSSAASRSIILGHRR